MKTRFWLLAAMVSLFMAVPAIEADELIRPPKIEPAADDVVYEPFASSEIELPIAEPDEERPQPVPIPKPKPKAITELPPDWFYVIKSPSRLVCLSSPPGILSVTEDEKSLRLRGKFAGGTGKIESKTFAAPWIYTIEGSAPGKVELLLVPRGLQEESEIRRTVLSVLGENPQPPPIPVDPVNPDPVRPDPVTPTIVTGPLQILVIEETGDRVRIPRTQLEALFGQRLREYCSGHCSKADGVTPDFRVIDKDSDVGKAEQWIQAAFKEPRTSLPWISLSNGKTGFSGPLPEDEDRLMQLLKRFGGE